MKPTVMVIEPLISVFGGAERQISQLVNYLTQHDYPITIFTIGAVPQFRASLTDARLVEAGSEQNLVNLVNQYAPKFHIINPHNHPAELYLQYSLKAIQVWQANEPPTYVLEGNPINENEKLHIQRSIAKAVVISDLDIQRFQDIYGFTPVRNYPGIRHGYFSEKVRVRNTLNMKDNFVLMQVGMFTFTKNQHRTVECFAEVKKEIPEAKLVLAGGGLQSPYGQLVDKKITDLNLEDDVLIMDYVPDDQSLRNLYKQASVFVNPVLSQGAWATTFEAICVGVPTIVSDKFIGANLLVDHHLGTISPIDQFADAVLKVYENYGASLDQTAQASDWIAKELTWENFGKRYDEIFMEVIQ